jgi:hypothetical protein
MKANVWYQIHTNGATTTFVRYRVVPVFYGTTPDGQDVEGTSTVFEKMSVDITAAGASAEIWGREVFQIHSDAIARMERALELAQ